MKSKLLDILKKYIDWLQKQYLWLAHSEEGATLPYHSLSPINDADKDRSYYNALNWALKNRKREDIKNIAITGPFGSGKSSVIKTFQEVNTDKDLHFLNISLATFKDEKSNEAVNQDLLRLIELSILQQILYHEEDKKIPDSRFGKIKSFTKQRMLYTTLALLTFILLTFNLFWHTILFKEFIRVEISSKWEVFLYYISLTTFTVGFGFIIFKSIRLLHGIRISKFKFQNTEIELSPNVSKSILNNHIDEILYFFEVTNYNIVVIEDLDRFEQTEIFTKLREINLLINSSKKVKDEVVFIYAVRDDMFIDKDRTKFFDFIIPIIPVINSSNSNEILLEKKRVNGYVISEDLIEDISLFIDDMRLLHNIINEYHVYHLKLNENLRQDKLLSMIVYKNIYPDDFSKLSCNDGILFKIINSKKQLIVDSVLVVDKTINDLKQEISELEFLKITDLNELKSLYILQYIGKITGFASFIIANDTYNYRDVLSEDLFTHFTNDNVKCKKYQEGYGNTTQANITFKFAQIEKEVNPNKNYQERKELIIQHNNNSSEILKRKIEELEDEKIKIKSRKIKELIINESLNFALVDNKQNELIRVLLLNGYIDEDYLDYISIFYEGSITKHDQEFLLHVKSQQLTDFDFNLSKIENLIKKINQNDFSKTHILNYNLVDYIIGNNQYVDQKTSVFKLLANGTERCINFIDGFIENGIKVELFVKGLCSYWTGIWDYINTHSTYTKEKKQLYFSLILEHADLDVLKLISEKSNFIQTASTTSTFLNIIKDEVKLKTVIESFSIRFTSLVIDDSSKEMIDFVYEGCFYELNSEMIELFIRYYGNFNRITFDTQNYNSIKNSKCDRLINYLNNNINDYISNVYLKINTNIDEDEVSLIELLNHKTLTLENKNRLIIKVKTTIKDLTEIEDLDICKILLSESKVSATWSNLIKFYLDNDNELSESSIIFLNQSFNANILSTNKIPTDKDENKTNNNFMLAILKENRINDDCYNLILKSISYRYLYLNFENFTSNKVSLLILNNILVLNAQNYNLMKLHFAPFHIYFIESQKNVYLEKQSEFILDQNDVLLLLRSNVLTSTEKNMIVNRIEESLITINAESIRIIGELLIYDTSFKVSDSLLKIVLISFNLSAAQKIHIFILNYHSVSDDTITEFLTNLGVPFSEILNHRNKSLIADTENNRRFAQVLKSKNYISSFGLEKSGKGIRIHLHRKSNN